MYTDTSPHQTIRQDIRPHRTQPFLSFAYKLKHLEHKRPSLSLPAPNSNTFIIPS